MNNWQQGVKNNIESTYRIRGWEQNALLLPMIKKKKEKKKMLTARRVIIYIKGGTKL